MGRAEFKVPGGKLMAAETEVEDGRLVNVKITGDFFMHPEEAIEELEDMLIGLHVDASAIEDAVEEFFHGHSIELIGASPRDFIHVLKMSLEVSSS